VKEFKSPASFPGGLAWDGKYLWIADYDNGKIYQLDSYDGKVLKSFRAPGHDPEGLTWDGQYLLHVDKGDARHLGSDAEIWIYKIDPSTGTATKVLKSPCPGHNSEDLEWDGNYLWYVDGGPEMKTGGTGKIYQMDIDSGKIIKNFDVPGRYPYGIAWDGAYLWVSDYYDETIDKISPIDGKVVEHFKPGFGSVGMTWDGKYLWTVDWETGKIYCLDVTGSS
jgi:DNA-binding beta-propeller fold protein YncE